MQCRTLRPSMATAALHSGWRAHAPGRRVQAGHVLRGRRPRPAIASGICPVVELQHARRNVCAVLGPACVLCACPQRPVPSPGLQHPHRTLDPPPPHTHRLAAEHLQTTGDVGRPCSALVTDFPQVTQAGRNPLKSLVIVDGAPGPPAELNAGCSTLCP